MKIKEYPKATSLAKGDAFIIDNDENGTRYILEEDLPWGEGGSVPATDPAWVSHRNTYRGKNLGTVFTDEQKKAIANETFNDFYIGDYWTIGGFDWLIADINYWLNTGDTICDTPHLVIIPKTSLYKSAMEATNTSANGYLGSQMYKSGLNQAKTIIKTAFGEDYILKKRYYLSNKGTDYAASSRIWVDSQIDLMNQIMVYGNRIAPILSSTNNTYTAYQQIDKDQLSLFKIKPDALSIKDKYWLDDIVTPLGFAVVSDTGVADGFVSSNSIGVRPAFGLIGKV